MRALLACLILISLAVSSSSAQSPSTRLGKLREDSIPGYTIKSIEGFTVVVSDETMRQSEQGSFKRKPLDVLAEELKQIDAMMPEKIVRLLRTVPIWAEWDERRSMSNGRPGEATAIYLGGHQSSLLARGEHPLKAKSVVILRTEQVTRLGQDGRSGMLLLHELAHAVHFELLGGRSNPHITAAYRQALDRELLDKSVYASTNEAEFFAEMTVAYFDGLDYHPRTREQLAKHDPITFKLMKSIWGEGKPRDAAGTSKPMFDLSVRLDGVDLGERVHGPALEMRALTGKPVAVVLWNANSQDSLSAFRKLTEWHQELADLGLVVLAVHRRGVGDSHDPGEIAQTRALPFVVRESRWTGQVIQEFSDFPHTLVFGPDGQCLYRGSPYDADNAIRGVVWRAVIERTKITTFRPEVAPVVEAMRHGRPMDVILPHLVHRARSTDEETATQARALMDELLAPGRELLREAVTMSESDPVSAFLTLESLQVRFKGTPIATEATAKLVSLKQTSAVRTELKARPLLEVIRKLDRELSSRAGSFDPALSEFREKNAGLLTQLAQVAQRMRTSFPNTHAAAETARVAAKYGLVEP